MLLDRVRPRAAVTTRPTVVQFCGLPSSAVSTRRPSGTLLTFNIECRTFDILLSRYRRCNLRYRSSENDIRYRVRYDNSISKVFDFDIECLNSEKRQYRRLQPSNLRNQSSTISKKRRNQNVDIKKSRSKRQCRRVSISKINRSRRMNFRYLSEVLKF